MKTLEYIFLILILLFMGVPIYGQDNTVIPQRTPEQEATKQTEKLQLELELNQEQAKQVYEINLKYARERQVSNTRSAAMERMKNKNAAIESVLNEDQNYRLQTKRYERATIEIPTGNRSTPANPPGYRSSSDYRSTPSVRVPSNENNLRNGNRSTTPQNHGAMQQNQTLRRSTTTPSYSPRVLQPSTRSSSGSDNSYSAPRQTVTPSSPQNNSSSRFQNTPSGTPKRAETQPTPNRR